MASNEQADWALEYYHWPLFLNKNLVKVSVRSRLSKKGFPTDEFYLEAGVLSLKEQKRAVRQKEEFSFVPRSLPLPYAGFGATSIDVEIIEVGPISLLIATPETVSATPRYTSRRRPAEGGNSLGNYRENSAGTLGIGIVTGNQMVGILTCWHVIARGADTRPGDHILQQARLDGGSVNSSRIGASHWASRTARIDAGVVLVDRVTDKVIGRFRSMGEYSNVIGRPVVNTVVVKSGRTTGFTRGTITSVNATVVINDGMAALCSCHGRASSVAKRLVNGNDGS